MQDKSTSPGARKWGEYTCDLPPWTLDQMLGDIAARHPDIAWVIVTGASHRCDLTFIYLYEKLVLYRIITGQQ